jgi:hypothetical protein
MRWRTVVGWLATVLVGLCLVPAGAHLTELPNKIGLSATDYMTVQRIYAGWALWGVAIFAAIAATLAHAILAWRDAPARRLSLGACLALVATQAVFWLYTFPMNALTRNWTVMPDNLDLARRQWEYSHAANALITFAAFLLITLAAVRSSGGSRARDPAPPG